LLRLSCSSFDIQPKTSSLTTTTPLPQQQLPRLRPRPIPPRRRHHHLAIRPGPNLRLWRPPRPPHLHPVRSLLLLSQTPHHRRRSHNHPTTQPHPPPRLRRQPPRLPRLPPRARHLGPGLGTPGRKDYLRPRRVCGDGPRAGLGAGGDAEWRGCVGV
jgi:hypothetical protein